MSRLGGRRCLQGMTDRNETTNVVVIGGGYAGTLAANHLRLRADVNIALVNPRPKFVERIRLHQHVAGNYDATVDYGTLLGEGIRLIVDSAVRIDTAARKVELASGAALDYDYVIYAVGSTGVAPSTVPGAARIRSPHRGIRVCATAACQAGRVAPRRSDHGGRRRIDRHRDSRRTRRAGTRGHAGVWRNARAIAERAGSSSRSPGGCHGMASPSSTGPARLSSR